MKDYYAILGCTPDTPQAEIIERARAAAMRINEAYNVLKDPVARAEYDKTLIKKPIPSKIKQPRFSYLTKPPLNLKELQTGFVSFAIVIIVGVFVWDMLFSKPTTAPQPTQTESSVIYFDKGFVSYKCKEKMTEQLNTPISLDFKNAEFTAVAAPNNPKLIVYGVTGLIELDDDNKNFVCVVKEDKNFIPSHWFVSLII